MLVAGRSAPKQTPAHGAQATQQAPLVNRVWKVDDASHVAPGQLYVFLSEGTLVIASAHGTPTVGSALPSSPAWAILTVCDTCSTSA